MQLIKNFIAENKKMLIVVCVIIVLVVIVNFYINSQKQIKIYYSNDYVYTSQSYSHGDGYVSELPYINIKGQEIEDINNKLINEYYKIIEFDEKMLVYEYYIYEDILSLIIKKYYLSSPDSYPSVDTYNVDINKGMVVADEKLFEMFDLSEYNVSEIINGKINEYYNCELQKGYIDSSCDFDCYLDSTKSLPITQGKYYLKDNSLYVHKKINLDMNFYYDTSSGFDLFNIKIK